MLTDLKIKNLPLPDKRREIPDGRISGLYFVVQPTGAKSWALRYRANGLPRKLTLGLYPALDLATARRRAQEALGEVAGGKDPAATKKAFREVAKADKAADDRRVARVAELFIERYVKRSGKVRASWAAEIERYLKVEILPHIGAKRIGNVTKHDILSVLDGIVDRGSPVTANRVLAVMRKFFNWASDVRGLIVVSPCKGIGAPTAESSRDRVLSDDEIRAAWAAFDDTGWPFGPLARLLLLTGQRLSEVAEAQWSEIDLEAKAWKIPKERTKNDRAHEVPLSDAAVEIIRALPRIEGKAGYVFTATGARPVSNLKRLREALRRAASERDAAPTLHDLRRTVATSLQRLGVRLEVTEAVLNHVSGSRKGIVGVYQRHEYAEEKRAALDAWARRLDAIVTGEAASNVVELAKTKVS
jgi:integrase